MSNDKVETCADGSPCQRCQGVDGYCWQHSGEGGAAGRPAYEPTDQDQRTVKALAMSGWSAGDIAPVIGISEPTLRKHFSDELDTGEAAANASVAANFYQAASSGQQWKASLKWLERRDPEHWKSADELQVSGPDGDSAPLMVIKTDDDD